MIERSIKKNYDKFTPHDFAIIFKSYAKAKIAKTGLLNFFNYFIEKNINNFGYYECVDVVINYPRVFTESNFKYELFFKIYSQAIQNIEKLEINRLVNLYFVLYGGNDKIIRDKIRYEQRLLDLIISKENKINSKHIYLMFLTHHFSKLPFSPELVHLLTSYVYNNMRLFLPEEMNCILNILNDNKNKELFIQFEIEKINKLFISTLKQEINKMDAKEIILYLHTLLHDESKLCL